MSEDIRGRMIDGRAIAKEIDAATAKVTAELQADGIQTKLLILHRGENADDISYQHEAIKQGASVNIAVEVRKLPDDLTPESFAAILAGINADTSIHGVLVQTLKDDQLQDVAQTRLSTEKDPEGITSRHMGQLLFGKPEVLPCTPGAIVAILKHELGSLQGKTVAIVNSSPVIGRPLSLILPLEGATPFMCGKHTGDKLPEIARSADILVTATGRHGLIGPQHLHPGQVVIDASIIRVGDHHLVGDVDVDAVKDIVSAITPVPGGVGPVTTATLLSNTAKLADLHRGEIRKH